MVNFSCFSTVMENIKRCRLIQYFVVITKNDLQTESERQRKVETAGVRRKQAYPLQSPLLTEGNYKLFQTVAR